LEAGDAAVIGKITSCFGIKGYVRVYPYTSSAARFRALSSVAVGETAEQAVMKAVEDVKIGERKILIKFAGIDDRTAAEGIVGGYLFVKESERPRPAKGSFYLDEIVGCEVRTERGERIGTVEEVSKNSAQDVWIVRDGGKEYAIPAVKEFIRNVDVRGKKITVRLIEGLLTHEG
jgi:16S rRNA processing protein RimM